MAESTSPELAEKAIGNSNTSDDIGAQFLQNHGEISFSADEERRCLRVIDWVMMPVMFCSFGFQYMDKACLTGAALFGIVEDLGLFDVEMIDGEASLSLRKYSYTSLIFFWGYFVGILPAVFLCQRFPIAKYVGVVIILWGGVTICAAAVNSYEGLLLQRFFLGFTEAGIAPAFSLITAMWYKREEQPLRFAIWYSSTGLGTLLGTLLLYAVGHIHGPWSSWRYQFLILGCITAVWGMVVLAVLPDSPISAKFLNDKQKAVAVERMRGEQTGIENKTLKMYQIKEAFLDPKTWLAVAFIFTINITNGAVGGFGSVVTTSFGYSTMKSILLLGVVGALAFGTLLGTGLISVYVRNARCTCALVCCLPVIAGAVMIWKSSWVDKAVPLWGLFLLGFFPAAHVMMISLVGANTAGHSKKAATAGLIWLAYCCSNGIAPLTVLTTEKTDHYPTTFKIILAAVAFSIFLLGTLRYYIHQENRKRDAVGTVDDDAVRVTAFYDLTDRENPNFRYCA